MALFGAVRLGMLPGRVFRMLVGMGVVCVGNVRVVSRFFMVASFVMLCCLGVVMGSL
ncbi:MAG: hypothetical protein JOY95_14725 [Silvibacterium sp.]|nr:hypothetical protein [Silvibacterium sp.]